MVGSGESGGPALPASFMETVGAGRAGPPDPPAGFATPVNMEWWSMLIVAGFDQRLQLGGRGAAVDGFGCQL